MKKRINRQLMLIAAIGIAATLILSTIIFYRVFQVQVFEDLKGYANILTSLNASDELEDGIRQIYAEELRVTMVLPDGTVALDTNADIGAMDNHSERGEISRAFSAGQGTAVRRSQTLDKNTFYYAQLQEDGSVIRVAKEAGSIWGVFRGAIPLAVVVAAVIFVLCFFLARLQADKLLAPINEIAENIDQPEKCYVYEELEPFVTKISDYHRTVLDSAKLRQDFTANVSHELKTPLTAISGYAELMESGMASETDVAHFSGEIRHNANRLLTLINDTIRLSELDIADGELQTERLDLYQIAAGCVKTMEIPAKKRDITITMSGEKSMIDGNRMMLEEIIYNLCENAIRYNKPDGRVEVSVYPYEDDVILSVKDSGIGIPREHQEHIFERFYRVDKSRSKSTGGTGLGLAIVKHAVAKHHAALDLESEPGVGTKIMVTFPESHLE